MKRRLNNKNNAMRTYNSMILDLITWSVIADMYFFVGEL